MILLLLSKHALKQNALVQFIYLFNILNLQLTLIFSHLTSVQKTNLLTLYYLVIGARNT